MMDTAISGPLSPAGNVSAPSSNANTGKSDKNDKPGGFQNALSSVKNSNQKHDNDKATAQTAADADELLNGETVGTDATAEKTGALRTSLRSRAASALIDLQQAATPEAAPEAEAGKTADLLGRKPTTAAKIDIASLKTAASTEKTLPAAELEKLKAAAAAKSKLDDATTVAGDTDADTDASETPAASKSADDVLSILNSMNHAKSAKAANAAASATDATGLKHGEAERNLAVSGTAAAAADLSAADIPGIDTASDSGDSGRTFRLTGARGRSVDMTVSSGSDDKAEFKVSASSNGNAENIAVLESRRYIGLATNSNGSALTSAISGNPEWSSAMQPGSELSNAAAASSTGRVVNTLKLQMHPIDLGAVTATLRLTGDELSVHLTVQTGAAYRQLTDDGNSILDALKAQGFAVDQVTVSLAPVAASDSSNSSTTGGQGQSAGQQAMLNDNSGGNASANGGQNGARSAGEDSTGTSNNALSDIGAAAGALGARPNLYL